MTALGGIVLEAAGAAQLAEGQIARGILMVAVAGAAITGLCRDLRREGLEPAGPALYVPEDWQE